MFHFTDVDRKVVSCQGPACGPVDARPKYPAKVATDEHGYKTGLDPRNNTTKLLCPVCHDHYTAKMIAEEQEHAARKIKVSEKALIKASSKAQRGQFTFPVQAVSPGHRSRSATSGANPGGPPISGSASLTQKMQTHGTQKSGSKMIAGVKYNVKAEPDVVEVKDGGAIVVDAFLRGWV
ncbi:hypothetical protein SISNIDRAFT_490991 [Sistotremastrum niveocremeum HHB9708]|uniref:Uncharacterized protein n=1 Tax=Sistotremastrum niveocremeum HHB9708 TaxID=1314777 RepID=A0A164NAY7_9AGAM|nr:hypothetical protein SISNIDRAFT_490991 [Sistotremastrum niveocremeum HHB9708]